MVIFETHVDLVTLSLSKKPLKDQLSVSRLNQLIIKMVQLVATAAF